MVPALSEVAHTSTHLEPVLCDKRSHGSEKPAHRNGEQPLLVTTRGSLCTATKICESGGGSTCLLRHTQHLVHNQCTIHLCIVFTNNRDPAGMPHGQEAEALRAAG